jgi:hypothetical protein
MNERASAGGAARTTSSDRAVRFGRPVAPAAELAREVTEGDQLPSREGRGGVAKP